MPISGSAFRKRKSRAKKPKTEWVQVEKKTTNKYGLSLKGPSYERSTEVIKRPKGKTVLPAGIKAAEGGR